MENHEEDPGVSLATSVQRIARMASFDIIL